MLLDKLNCNKTFPNYNFLATYVNNEYTVSIHMYLHTYDVTTSVLMVFNPVSLLTLEPVSTYN